MSKFKQESQFAQSLSIFFISAEEIYLTQRKQNGDDNNNYIQKIFTNNHKRGRSYFNKKIPFYPSSMQ